MYVIGLIICKQLIYCNCGVMGYDLVMTNNYNYCLKQWSCNQ